MLVLVFWLKKVIFAKNLVSDVCIDFHMKQFLEIVVLRGCLVELVTLWSAFPWTRSLNFLALNDAV